MRPARCWRKRGIATGDHEGELTEAPGLLAQLPLRGRTVTGDALYCQRSLCQQIRVAGGHYLVFVKENQPTLVDDIRTLFVEPPPGEVFATAEQEDRGHGRHEIRRLAASTALTGYLDWPDVAQVVQVERVVEAGGQTSGETRYAVTSHGSEVGPDHLLGMVRGHWGIENRLHYVRDVTMGEDASRIRTGAAPQVLAALRNVVLNLLHHQGTTNVAARLREIGWQGTALHLLGLVPS